MYICDCSIEIQCPSKISDSLITHQKFLGQVFVCRCYTVEHRQTEERYAFQKGVDVSVPQILYSQFVNEFLVDPTPRQSQQHSQLVNKCEPTRY